MHRVQWFVLCLIGLASGPGITLAQHSRQHGSHHTGPQYHNGPHQRVHSHPSVSADSGYWSTSPYTSYVSPVVGGGGYFYPQSEVTSPRVHHHHYPLSYPPIFVSTGPVWLPDPLAPVAPTPSVSVVPLTHPTPPNPQLNPAKQPAKPSTAAGKLKSLEQQVLGDEKLRKGQWAMAYMNYRSAIDTAGDRGEARLRMGFCYTAMKQYTSAIREFKRGMFLDPEQAATGIRLPMLFGPGSEIVRTSVLNKVADWVREDNLDSDRWFLLGLLLHYENDPRASEALKAARQLSGGDDDHIVTLLGTPLEKSPVPEAIEGKPALLAELPPLPLAGLAQVPLPLPPGLPPLSDQPMPLVAPMR